MGPDRAPMRGSAGANEAPGMQDRPGRGVEGTGDRSPRRAEMTELISGNDD